MIFIRFGLRSPGDSYIKFITRETRHALRFTDMWQLPNAFQL